MLPAIIAAVIIATASITGAAIILTDSPQEIIREPTFWESLTEPEKQQVANLIVNGGDPVWLESQSTIYYDKYMVDEDTFQIIASPDVMNYYNSTGNLVKVNTTIVESSDPDYKWEANRSVYKAFFTEYLDEIKIQKDDYWATIGIDGFSYRNNEGEEDAYGAMLPNIPGTVEGNRINYSMGSIDVIYEFQNSRLKTSIYLNKPIGPPDSNLFPPACTINNGCDDFGITFDVDFTYNMSDNLAMDGTHFNDISTGDYVMSFEPPFSMSQTGQPPKNQEYAINGTSIIQKTDWQFFRNLNGYPIVIDPTTTLNYTNEHYYTLNFVCDEQLGCCVVGSFGACFNQTNCVQTQQIGLKKPVNASGCYPCDNNFPVSADCCENPLDVNAGYIYPQFNLSGGINNSFTAITIDYATLNLTFNDVPIGEEVYAFHVPDNSTTCYANYNDDTYDNHSQPAPISPGAGLNKAIFFEFTDHVQANVDLNKEMLYFFVNATINTDANKMKLTKDELNITFSVDGCELFPNSNTELNCSDNCTFTYHHSILSTKNLSIVNDGNLTFNDVGVAVNFLNLSLDSDDCSINLVNYTVGDNWNISGVLN